MQRIQVVQAGDVAFRLVPAVAFEAELALEGGVDGLDDLADVGRVSALEASIAS